MLKGRATIDLHDTIKGTYKRIVKENLVTNAYKYHLQSTILMNGENNLIDMTGSNGALSIGDVTLAGLLLFDGPLVESVENVHLPGDVHIVGYSDRSVDTSNPKRGSYNTLESGKTDSGITNVWDFTTAQANGIISALSLTNIKAGADPIGYCINRDISGTTSTARAQYIYHDGIYGYYLSFSGSRLTITKSFQPQTAISVNTYNFAGSRNVGTYTIDMSGDSKAILEQAYWQYAGNGNLYAAIILADNSDDHSALTVRIAKIHTDDWENFTYTAAEDISLAGVTGRKTINSATSMFRQPPVVSGHHIYIQGYQEVSGVCKKIYIADLDNLSDIIETTVDTDNPGANAAAGELVDWRQNYPSYNGTADFFEKSGQSYYRVRVYPDGTVAKSVTASLRHVMRGLADKNAPINAHFSRGTGSNWGVFTQTAYLGTICNITPIEKTSAQTMKVTYTLTDVQ